MAPLEQPCCSLRPLTPGQSTWAPLAGSPRPPWGYSKGEKNQCTKVPALHWSFHPENWMAGGVDWENAPPPRWSGCRLSGWLLRGYTDLGGGVSFTMVWSIPSWSALSLAAEGAILRQPSGQAHSVLTGRCALRLAQKENSIEVSYCSLSLLCRPHNGTVHV